MLSLRKKSEDTIIVRRRRGGHEEEHHGGVWKIAFADFMTAMMALFLILWLINVTTDDQKKGIANYFNPMAMETNSASDGALAGKEVSDDGADTGDVKSGEASETDTGETEETRERSPEEIAEEERRLAEEKAEQDLLDAARDEITRRISSSVDLKLLSENLIIEDVEEGLRIQITDKGKVSMFALGSAKMNEQGAKLVAIIGEAIRNLPNRVSITGHTDGVAFSRADGYGNWELSSERANAARRGLVQAGVDINRVARVEGLADRDHLFPEDPEDPRNRRVSITILRKGALRR
jgi:Flagellar motor protein